MPPPVAVAAPTEAPHVWFRGEILAWWVKNAPVPAPIALVTRTLTSLVLPAVVMRFIAVLVKPVTPEVRLTLV